MKFRNLGVLAVACLWLPCAVAQQYSQSPRQTGEAILEELLIGKKGLAIKVGSGGCTGKASFHIDAKKVDGISPQVPHYILTINRVAIDECKAIVDDGPVIYWDLEKDLGLKGKYTISVRNMVTAVPSPFETEDAANSMLSAVKRKVSMEGWESQENSSKSKTGGKQP